MSFDPINNNLLDSSLMANNYIRNNRYGYHNAIGDTEGEAEGEAETENEDYTEYENEEGEVGDTSQTDLPKFRQLVRAKKAEMKSQYGKAHIESTTVRKCATVQVPKVRMVDKEVCVNVPYTHWDSNINCSSVCVKWNLKLECTERKEKCLGGFIGGTRQECKTIQVPQAYTEAEEVCVNMPRFKWVSGWRKQWREFKRNGGLQELKMMSKGLLPIEQPTPPPPTYYTPPPPPPQPTEPEQPFDEYQEWTCQELSDEYGIIAGQTFGNAPQSAINSWIKRGCNTKPTQEEVETETEETETEIETDDEAEESGKPKKKKKSRKSAKSRPTTSKRLPVEENKILGMPKDVAITVGVAVLALGTFMVIRKIMKS